MRRPFRWPFADKLDVADGQSYRFYFDEWVDNVPVCQTVDDVFTLCNTFLGVSGVCIGQDPELLCKISAIGVKSLRDDPSADNRHRWLELLRRLLVPALSLIPENPSCVEAVWEILKNYPLRERYGLYSEWYEGPTSRLPAVKKAFERIRRETMGIMRRISKDNKAVMGRALAKTSLTAPGIVFRVALGQLEVYDNIIDVFVSCARYFTKLGYDVLVWSLMSSLGGKQRSRTQATSVLLTSKWLQALSRFSGQVFSSYATMDVAPVVQYVHAQLLRGNSTDLIILKELVLSMGGLLAETDFTEAQIQAMTGGPLLRRHTLISLGDRRFQSQVSAKRLMKALVDTRLAGRLLLNLAQYRQAALFADEEKGAHIKFLATVVDDTHQVLAQYLDLLRSNLTVAEFDALVPSIPQLMLDFGLDAGLAFMIGRAGLDFHGAVAGEKGEEDGKKAEGKDDNDKDAMDVDAEAEAADMVSIPSLGPLQPLVDAVGETLPSHVRKHMDPAFYVTFWALEVGDLVVPRARYDAEIDRLRKEGVAHKSSRHTDNTRAAVLRRNGEAETLMKDRQAMAEEMLTLSTRNRDTKKRLQELAAHWLGGGETATAQASVKAQAKEVQAVADVLLERCLVPRLLLSAADTEFSFRMVKFLHENRSANFQLSVLYGRLLSAGRLRDLIFTCTVREAEQLGRFLRLILGELARWHADKGLYEREGLGRAAGRTGAPLTGFAKLEEPTSSSEETPQQPQFVEHAEFRDLLYGWHKNLNIALKDCLEDLEWMHVRNAISVLKAVMDVFPAVDFMGRQFAEQLKRIAAREAASSSSASSATAGHRVDLSVTAQAVYSELQRRKTKWVMVQAFRSNASSKISADEAKAAAAAEAESATSLRPSAPEFKPQRRYGKPNHRSRRRLLTKLRRQEAAEVEDGELKDAPARNTTAAAGTAASQGTPSTVPSGPRSLTNQNNRPTTPRANAGGSQAKAQSTLTSLPHSHSLPNRPDVPVPGRYPTDRFGQVRNQERGSPALPDNSGREQRGMEMRGPREPRELRDARDPRDARDLRDTRDFRTPEHPRMDRPLRDFSGQQDRNGPGGSGARHNNDRDWNTRADNTPTRFGPRDRAMPIGRPRAEEQRHRRPSRQWPRRTRQHRPARRHRRQCSRRRRRPPDHRRSRPRDLRRPMLPSRP